jgi:serine/threonine protein kinase
MAAICTNCPEPTKLRQLIESALPDEEQSGLVAHLDACESCQKSIEHIAAGGSGLTDCFEDPDKIRPEQTSAYWPALKALEREAVKVARGPYAPTRSEAELDPLLAEVSLDFLDPPEQPGTLGKLGRFHVVELIGRGGMGIVLRGLDVCLQRQIALKVLDPQFARNDLARNRFIREARAAASITHENVVAVHHVEKHREEVPFLVMRLIAGESLQDRLDAAGGPLPLREILTVGRQMAAGLAAAHAQGLIHRDIKPANILLESGTGKVLLTDFGLARAVEDAKLTRTGFVAGTPLYMSPEQARGEALDHRSDLFSLGSVLYAMCTGDPPFQGSSAFVVLRVVTAGQHRPVQALNPKVPDDLAGVIDHLLAKRPDDRIQSASEVADLLGGIQDRLPPDPADGSSRRTRRVSRLGRSWWGRNAPAVAAALLFLNGLLLASELARLTHWTIIGQRGEAHQVEAAPPATAAEEAGPRPLLEFDAQTGPIWSTAYSPDGNTLAVALDDGSVELRNPHTGKLRSRVPAHKRPVWKVAFSNDGRVMATAGDDGLVRLWDTRTNEELDTIQHPLPVRAIAFSPDSTRIATGTRGGAVRVWDVKTGKQVIVTAGHTDGVVMGLAFSGDGTLLASASGDHTVMVWDVSDDKGREVTTLRGHKGGVYSVAFHPTKRVVASGSWDHTIRIWDVEMGRQVGVLDGHREDVWAVAFSPDGTRIGSGSEDRTAKIWDAETHKELHTFRGQSGTVYGVAFSPDGTTLATGSRNGLVKLWDAE